MHPNFMIPFEYGKLFHNKSFPKIIGTSTSPNHKIIRSLDMLKSQIGRCKSGQIPIGEASCHDLHPPEFKE